jgi:hypothetical protein
VRKYTNYVKKIKEYCELRREIPALGILSSVKSEINSKGGKETAKL